MYLKSIEMQGFKSFAGKTKLEFHNGVTGIVGPNGSGKSNVGDAVRWVLGEQSAKQLRGGNMQDVIFAGTENRKPLGFASVAITLDNADRKLNFDADEVTVTRKLYRSGESEYLLNGRGCRLKDINELFYDTGIGKEGYSIIGQGQIEKILSGKPEDRRELFDEAAGIVKFKKRKNASLKKLEDEQSNLVRVNDILTEVSGRLGPLERQSHKAAEYLEKRDILKNLDIRLFQIEEGRTEEQLEQLEKNKKIAENQLQDVNAEFEKTRQEYDRIEEELTEIETKLNSSREEAQKAEVEKQQREGQMNVLREQIHAAEANSQILQNRLNSIHSDQKTRKENLEQLLREEEELNHTLQEKLSEKAQAEQQVEKLQAEIRLSSEKVEKRRSDTMALLNSRSSIKERMQHYDTMLEQINIRKAELHSRIMQIKVEEVSETEKRNACERELREVSELVISRQQENEEKEKKLAEMKKFLGETNRALEAKQTEFHRESSRLESLRNIAERYEGYGNSIKKVMEQKETNPGIHGVIADLIKTDQRYETAIETALGGALQNIVTDNEATAKYLIEFLKRGHYGRATFLPLTAMREENSSVNAAVLKENGVLGKADELVRCEKIYRGVVKRLLGKTVVVDTIDHAIGVSRRFHQSVRIVTLEGELISPGGSMTGGSFRYNSNLLGRRRQIAELEDSVKKLRTATEELQNRIQETRSERNVIRDSLTELGDELQKLYLRQNTAKVNFDSARERAEAIASDYERLNREFLEIENQIAEFTEKRALVDDELADSENAEKDLNSSIQDIQEAHEALLQRERSAQTVLEEMKLAYSGTEQQVRFKEERIRDERFELERLAEEEKTLTEDLSQGGRESEEKEELIEAIRKAVAELELTAAENQRTGEELTAQKENLGRSHKVFFEKRDALVSEKGELDKEIFRLGEQINKLNETKDNQINYLYEEYHMTPDQAEAVVFADVIERGPLKKQISEVRSEIKALGNINVNAIEEYKELKERHDFLQTQHDDLIKAEEQLQGIIQQLDDGMRRQFKERFAQIREEFDKVFKLLFGGGKGTIELVEDEDILEAGIVIISQPPGKKLQNMMQLSGGEKALTAIALLFAIQNLKPSPFCLLDEIEAALDDNNVGRFAKYLHKLTKHTQFIIITHRRGTMAAADRLYGITMQEKGVSALVSVNLIESQLDE